MQDARVTPMMGQLWRIKSPIPKDEGDVGDVLHSSEIRYMASPKP
jgi:hypothetical protein